MKKIKLIYIIALILLSGCEDFLDRQPLDASASTTYWTTEEDVKMAVDGCYLYLRNIDNDIFLVTATDDAYCPDTWPVDIHGIANGSATAATGAFETYWTQYYKGIAAANNVLDNIDQVTSLTEDTKNAYKAEAKFIRAYFYHLLVGYYGDVPLLTTTPETDELDVAQTSAEEITEFILSELDEIAPNLPITADIGRITKGCALGLKARVLLYNSRWIEAAAAAKEVMDLGIYGIEQGGFLSLFNGTNKGSEELIMTASYLESPNSQRNGVATWIGGKSLGGWRSVVPLQALVDTYECTDGKTIDESPLFDPENPLANRDPRLGLTIVLPGAVVNGITIDITQPTSPDRLGYGSASGYFFKKYIPYEISGDYYNNSANDEVLMRYAEILLIYAEAKIEAGAVDQSVFDAINQLRSRTGVAMPEATFAQYSDQTAQRALVRRERRVELALEPLRLFDIRRWNIAQDVLTGTAYGIYNNFDSSRTDYRAHVSVETRVFNPGRDNLWAIPQSEIDINSKLVQNPGW